MTAQYILCSNSMTNLNQYTCGSSLQSRWTERWIEVNLSDTLIASSPFCLKGSDNVFVRTRSLMVILTLDFHPDKMNLHEVFLPVYIIQWTFGLSQAWMLNQYLYATVHLLFFQVFFSVAKKTYYRFQVWTHQVERTYFQKHGSTWRAWNLFWRGW